MRFLIHWLVTGLSLWAASYVFKGIRFTDAGSLVIAALLLGLANAIVRPILILLTLPITILTLGLFLFVVNALMLMLVSALVNGFTVASFGTALLASIFMSVLSWLVLTALNSGTL